MSKTAAVKKVKAGTHFAGPGFEFIHTKAGFHEVNWAGEDGKEVATPGDLIVTPAEAKRMVAEHNGSGTNSKKLKELQAKHDKMEVELSSLEEKIAELEDDEFIEETDSGFNVIHDGSTIRVGCNSIPFVIAKRAVSLLR